MQFSRYLSRWSLCALFGLLTLLLNSLAHGHPEFIEKWYSRGFFQGVRLLLDSTSGRLPFASFYLFWAGVVAFLTWLFVRRPRKGSVWPKTGYWLSRLAGFAGLVFGLFFWMWGFNYARIPVEKQLKLKVEALDSTALWQELAAETRALDSLRNILVGNDTNALNDKRFWPAQAEDTVRKALTTWLAAQRFPVKGRVRGRFIYPEGTLFKFGASGIYWPFVGEGNLEGGMHPLQKLPSMAHEMSHGYGFCDEGVCNFLAYVACFEHPNAYIAYGARLDYWMTLSDECWRSDRIRYDTQYRQTVPAGVLADEAAIHAQNRKFSELAPAIRYEVYDSYLKAQGVDAGMKSYDEVLMLVWAWKQLER